MTKRWMSTMPERCDICHNSLKSKPFVDGRTAGGPWATMCEQCHKRYGVGLGTGKGQKYNAEGIKIEG